MRDQPLLLSIDPGADHTAANAVTIAPLQVALLHIIQRRAALIASLRAGIVIVFIFLQAQCELRGVIALGKERPLSRV